MCEFQEKVTFTSVPETCADEKLFLHLLKVWLKGLWQMLRQMITALLLTEMKFGEEH